MSHTDTELGEHC